MTALVAGPLTAGLAEVAAAVADRAEQLDAAQTDIRHDLRALAEAGAFSLKEFPDAVRAIEHVSASSLAVGFSAWAHWMAIQYVSAGPVALRDHVLDALSTGQRPGVTAMAAGLKHVAGLGRVPVTAEEHRGGVKVSGPIRWASNVFGDAVIVLPARTADGRHLVVAVDADTPGVRIDPPPTLMALGATASTSLQLREVVVAPGRIISTDLPGFVHRIKPTFLLLQTAFCVGVAGAALAGAAEAGDGLAAQFDGDLAALVARADDTRSRMYEFSAAPGEVDLAAIIRLRLDAAGVAVDATRLESALAGGQGYRVGSAANRRFREAAFLPIQSPSEGQLRWELKRYE